MVDRGAHGEGLRHGYARGSAGNADSRAGDDVAARVEPVGARDRLDADSVPARDRGERFASRDAVCPGLHSGPPRDRAPGAHAVRAQTPCGARADDSVPPQPRAPLEPTQRSGGPGTETPVERAGSQAVPPEQELEDPHVIAAQAAPKGPGPEEGPPLRAQGGARSRSCQAVDCEPLPPLVRANRADRLRPLDAVDRPSVEIVVAQSDLEPGDLRVQCARGGGEREGREGGCGREGQASHPHGVCG